MQSAFSANRPALPRRFLSLHLPYLPTDRIARRDGGRSWRSGAPAEPHAPVAIVAREKSALRLTALDAHAQQIGLRRGQPLAEARAMIPALVSIEEDPAADAALLADIADWADRYTPLVALDGDDGLMLDITGVAHLFGGEAALAADIVARLALQGFAARAAIADTPGAASAAARYGGPQVVPAGEQAKMLAELPVAALRLPFETVAAMDRVGLKRIGQILEAPRAPLAARFGSRLILRLDQALGRVEEAIGPRRPPPAFIAERRFAEPVMHRDDIAQALAALAARLGASLEERGEGARELELALFRVDGAVKRIALSTSRPVRTPRLVGELFREKFAGSQDEIDAGFGFDVIRLSAFVTERIEPSQTDMTGGASGAADLDRLIDRIGARLPRSAVGRPEPVDSHWPERSVAIAPAAHAPVWEALPADEPIDRPLRLFARPEPVEAMAEVPDGPPVRFRWRRVLYLVARAEGPERIAPEWWRGGEEDQPTRDYFRVEDESGHRFWLFREGLYGRETAAPRWFMHGVFG
jgi:protein ImuB